jgi:AcrR family transcriptional regulator
MKNVANTPRLSREQWLKNALESLGHEAGARLRIDTLVAKLGVTKGSFYWHFKSRDEFVRSLIDYWHENATLVVPHYVGVSGSAEERLLKLINVIFKEQLTRYDLAVRSWAIQEPDIRTMIRRTDVFRHNFIRALFEEMGFDNANADMRCRTLVTYAALYGAVFDQLSEPKQLAQIELMFAMLTRSID